MGRKMRKMWMRKRKRKPMPKCECIDVSMCHK